MSDKTMQKIIDIIAIHTILVACAACVCFGWQLHETRNKYREYFGSYKMQDTKDDDE